MGIGASKNVLMRICKLANFRRLFVRERSRSHPREPEGACLQKVQIGRGIHRKIWYYFYGNKASGWTGDNFWND